MTVLIEAEAKEIAELLTLAVSNERLIDKKIGDSLTKVANGISNHGKVLPYVDSINDPQKTLQREKNGRLSDALSTNQ